VSWQERLNVSNTNHPEFARVATLLAGLDGARCERARQFFSWCVLQGVVPARPDQLEAQVQACVDLLRERGLA
jgi:hypothetical protein